jgi:hypothetical protein
MTIYFREYTTNGDVQEMEHSLCGYILEAEYAWQRPV